MNTLKDLLKYISYGNFLTDFTPFNINSGIRARSLGIGTNKFDRQTTLRDEEIDGIQDGWEKFKAFGDKVVYGLKKKLEVKP